MNGLLTARLLGAIIRILSPQSIDMSVLYCNLFIPKRLQNHSYLKIMSYLRTLGYYHWRFHSLNQKSQSARD